MSSGKSPKKIETEVKSPKKIEKEVKKESSTESDQTKENVDVKQESEHEKSNKKHGLKKDRALITPSKKADKPALL